MLNSILKRFGSERSPRPFTEFLPFKETLAAAKAAGLSVGDFIESRHRTGARTVVEETMEGLAALGVFEAHIDKICEIGPGSGRYLEKIVARCQPKVYEIYETSNEWRNWLVEQYGVIARQCDGRTLVGTESDSVGLVHAHRVFPGTPFLNTVSNFLEMARVVRPGGWIVFDMMTEECFRPDHLQAWFDADPWKWAWSPHMTSRAYTVQLFAERNVSLVGSFTVPHFPAVTECIVFRKDR
jgi:hypothetical protein